MITCERSLVGSCRVHFDGSGPHSSDHGGELATNEVAVVRGGTDHWAVCGSGWFDDADRLAFVALVVRCIGMSLVSGRFVVG